ncbi:hypothetical protein [Rhizobium lentis]|uniref:hypothetical protein n=1 Tax=Rhizobium lentis TaxID=1138194 RepID=UPI001A917DF5|nr:hypothetical protein [Rhizobium lentis]MBX5063282.1 hypothetical protein [Rhizobium lentis]MBX5075387.1 hypothetical protein [Rhizobium lentis]QSW93046.1 hypothetical protein J0663_18520 [Rhizobium lentis]
MSDTLARLSAINTKLEAELAKRIRLSDALGKAVVVIWMGVLVFAGCALSEPQLKSTDLVNQEQVSWQK